MRSKYLTIIYIILVMVLVSLKETYSITHKIFGSKLSEQEYSDTLGFLIHILIFSALISVPLIVKL